MPKSLDHLFGSFEHEAKTLQNSARSVIEQGAAAAADESPRAAATHTVPPPPEPPAHDASPPIQFTPRPQIEGGVSWTKWAMIVVTVLLFGYLAYRYMGRSKAAAVANPSIIVANGPSTAQLQPMMPMMAPTSLPQPRQPSPVPRRPKSPPPPKTTKPGDELIGTFLDSMKQQHRQLTAMQKKASQDRIPTQDDGEDNAGEASGPPASAAVYVSRDD